MYFVMGRLFSVILLSVIFLLPINAQNVLIDVQEGWANNSVNAVVFRKNSLVTYKDIQFIAFYDLDGYLVLGKRLLGTTDWTINKTPFKGNVKDAHNSISIMVDGDGYLHVSWDHHGNGLNYAKSILPESLELGEKRLMSGVSETNVTYPEFYKMDNGDLLFMYRDGRSGKGNLAMNYYNISTGDWTKLHENLIDGGGQRNAYWQATTDGQGVIHLSWVWRDSPDVATNHDMCYARSVDGGKTWEKSTGEKYNLPITKETAETVCEIPQNSELINQTSMTTDSFGNPYIASYWREQNSDVPQYHIVYNDGNKWHEKNLNFRSAPFSLKGGGTKSIPIARPQVIADKNEEGELTLMLLFRDEERGSKVSMAKSIDLKNNTWEVTDLTSFSVGAWEPTFDTELWKEKGLLHIFVQSVVQVDGEGQADVKPQMVRVLEASTKN